MTSLFGAVIAAVAIALIISTMPIGKRFAERLGLPQPSALFRALRGGARSAAPKREDHEYLLRVCDGDESEVERRLAVERARFTDLSEAEIYRRAIRTYLQARGEAG